MAPIIIDVKEHQNLEAVNQYLKVEIGFGIEPIPEFVKDCPLISAQYIRNGTDYELNCDLKFILAEEEGGNLKKELKASLTIEVTGQNQNYVGQLIYPLANAKTLDFDIQFQDKTSSILVATTAIKESLSLNYFEQALPDLDKIIPEEIEIGSNYNALIVMTKSGTKSGATTTRKFLLGLGFKTELNLNIDLSQLPLIGSQFPDPNSNYLVIQLIVSTKNFDQKELETINKLLVELKTPVKIQPPSSSQELTKGVSIAAELELIGAYQQSWFVPLVKRRISTYGLVKASNNRHIKSVRSTENEETPITVAENGVWLKVQRSFGPVHIEKIGLLYQDGEIRLVPEATLQISRFVLSLNALSARAKLDNDFVPYFKLEGFGLEYITNSLEISGAFAQIEKEGYDEYLGLASLGMKAKAKTLSLSAVGSFAYFKGEAALFLYIAVDYPLGGPPFFFVTGLAGGFGYNRSLTVPELDNLPSFPLVSQAINGVGSIDFNDPAGSVGAQLEQLDKYIKLSPGSGFLAVGVKFTSFKLVDSFALLTAAINEDKFELNLIGISRLVVPPKEAKLDPVAQVEMILRAQFAPYDGILSLQAQLTPASYILSTKCQLTGGFAFFLWFAGEHAGDFVITLGGYHPAFKVPKHYPTVPRLGFKWQIDSNTSITGEAYFALCSHAVMAGGRLSFDYDNGRAWASLSVGADFLICWKPYYYDIQVYVNIRAGIGFISGSLGVKLHLWGPELGGIFEIDLWLFSVTVRFGDQGSRDPLPIDWEDFCESFLPPKQEICSIAATEGLVKQFKQDEEEIWILNPKQFALVTDAFIPSQKVFVRGDEEEKATSPAFGINPMGIKSDSSLVTEHHVQINRKNDSQNWVPFEDQFTFEPVTKQAPTAMWGEPNLSSQGRLKLPEVNGKQFVEDVFFGFHIVPAQEPEPGQTQDIKVAALQYDTTAFDSPYVWEMLTAFEAINEPDADRRNIIRETVTNNTNRDSILSALGFDTAEMVSVDAAIADAFVFAPLVKK